MEVDFEFGIGTVSCLMPLVDPYMKQLGGGAQTTIGGGIYLGIKLQHHATHFIRYHGLAPAEAETNVVQFKFNRCKNVLIPLANPETAEELHILLMAVSPEGLNAKCVAGASMQLPSFLEAVSSGDVVQLSRTVELLADELDANTIHKGQVGSVQLRIRCRMQTQLSSTLSLPTASKAASASLQHSSSNRLDVSRPQILTEMTEELSSTLRKGYSLSTLSTSIGSLSMSQSHSAFPQYNLTSSRHSNPDTSNLTLSVSKSPMSLQKSNESNHTLQDTTFGFDQHTTAGYARNTTATQVIENNKALLHEGSRNQQIHSRESQHDVAELSSSPIFVNRRYNTAVAQNHQVSGDTEDDFSLSDSSVAAVPNLSNSSIKLNKTQILRETYARAPPEARQPTRDTFGRSRNLDGKKLDRSLRRESTTATRINKSRGRTPEIRLNKAAETRANFNKYLLARRAIPPALRYANLPLADVSPSPAKKKKKKKSTSNHPSIDTRSHKNNVLESEQISTITDEESEDQEIYKQVPLASSTPGQNKLSGSRTSDSSLILSTTPNNEEKAVESSVTESEYESYRSQLEKSDYTGNRATTDAIASSSRANSNRYQLHLNSESESESGSESQSSPISQAFSAKSPPIKTPVGHNDTNISLESKRSNFSNSIEISLSEPVSHSESSSVVSTPSPTKVPKSGRGASLNPVNSIESPFRAKERIRGKTSGSSSPFSPPATSPIKEKQAKPPAAMTAEERRAQMMARLQAARDNLNL